MFFYEFFSDNSLDDLFNDEFDVDKKFFSSLDKSSNPQDVNNMKNQQNIENPSKVKLKNDAPTIQTGVSRRNQKKHKKGNLTALYNIHISPKGINLLPEDKWKDVYEIKLGDMIETYFFGRSKKEGRFQHKLWNSLIITTHYPNLFPVIGVKWLNDEILLVNQNIFGNLLGLDKPKHSLFMAQGSFQTHGFVEIEFQNLPDNIKPYAERNNTHVKYFKHKSEKFRRWNKPDFDFCSWKPKGNVTYLPMLQQYF